ncbi:MAG: protein kinase, partial [Acidimicrobiia bacterium]|nr:protein kinase [Acidimicrobiia bacterium]
MSLADGLFGGRIALGDEIGRGAMGVVYQAALDDRQVAVKVLHPHLTSDLAVVGRFVREHQALSRIDHPNVVTVIDMIIDDPRLGIVMEHLDFPDLGKV